MRRPNFIAAQAGHARGLLGRIIAFIMSHETREVNLGAIGALKVGRTDSVLDVGCGHGRGLEELARRAPGGWVVGADPSELMVDVAVRRNRSLVRARRLEVVVAGAESLPFPERTFDKALCVHVIYFWSDIDAGFGEIARVLKPGGRLALVFRTSADVAAVQSFPADIYRFRTLEGVIAALDAAGFDLDPDRRDPRDLVTEPAFLVAVKRRA